MMERMGKVPLVISSVLVVMSSTNCCAEPGGVRDDLWKSLLCSAPIPTSRCLRLLIREIKLCTKKKKKKNTLDHALSQRLENNIVNKE
jgi:hypothetical protein